MNLTKDASFAVNYRIKEREIMDCHLNWNYHVLHVSKKIAKGIEVLNKFEHFDRVLNYVLSHIYCAMKIPFSNLWFHLLG